ncbi:MAG: DUF6364 family protein [Burkholderiales bacterium]
MKTRVTITLGPDVHAHAKQVARARRTTVSGLIETFFRAQQSGKGRSSVVDDMVGSAELRAVNPGAEPLHDALHARHIARRR